MKLKMLALTLSTSCLILSGCNTLREAAPLRPDLDNPERMVCEYAGDRPVLPASYEINWVGVTTVAQARAEHEAYVERMVERNRGVTAYLVGIEGKLFVCANNREWWADYWSGLPDPE